MERKKQPGTALDIYNRLQQLEVDMNGFYSMMHALEDPAVEAEQEEDQVKQNEIKRQIEEIDQQIERISEEIVEWEDFLDSIKLDDISPERRREIHKSSKNKRGIDFVL